MAVHEDSRWTHAICDPCWNKREPSRVASRVTTFPDERCCVCGEPTNSGIYFRADPAELKCEGRDLVG